MTGWLMRVVSEGCGQDHPAMRSGTVPALSPNSCCLELQLMEQRVAPVVAQQLVVLAGLHHMAVVDHQDAVGVHDGGEPMRDRQRGAAAAELCDRLLDVALGLGVERGGCFGAQNDLR